MSIVFAIGFTCSVIALIILMCIIIGLLYKIIDVLEGIEWASHGSNRNDNQEGTDT